VEKTPQIQILSWSRSYDLRKDGVTFTEASCKQYFEDLLAAVCQGLERRRPSSSSTTSAPSLQEPKPSTSGTRQRAESVDHDMRYCMQEKEAQ
jgi:hypothetical protein